MITHLTIHEGLATFEDGTQSRALAILAALPEVYRMEIILAAQIALKEDHILKRMDMGDEHAMLVLSDVEEASK
jgi:hypothetical protein